MGFPIDRRSAGFTLVELLTVMVIISILAAILFPVFGSARKAAQRTSCLNNQRQIAVAVAIYAHDHDGHFPGTSWQQDVNMAPKIFECPEAAVPQSSYGFNYYLSNTRQDLISKPSFLIVTCDSSDLLTTSGDMNRHSGGAIFSHLDGSCLYTKNAATAGRFTCGAFPLPVPTTTVNGVTTVNMPDGFISINGSASADVSDFLVAGPYGTVTGTNSNAIVDGVDCAAWDTSKAPYVMAIDYLNGEKGFSQLMADASPESGDIAPQSTKICASNPTDTAVTGNRNTFTSWTKVPDPAGVWQMMAPKNYNAQCQGQTTYAVAYLFSPTNQSASGCTIELDTDDLGKLWMNGTVNTSPILSNTTNVQSGYTPVGPVSVPIPQGISYLLIRNTNWTAGMKFRLVFNGYTGIGLSSALP